MRCCRHHAQLGSPAHTTHSHRPTHAHAGTAPPGSGARPSGVWPGAARGRTQSCGRRAHHRWQRSPRCGAACGVGWGRQPVPARRQPASFACTVCLAHHCCATANVLCGTPSSPAVVQRARDALREGARDVRASICALCTPQLRYVTICESACLGWHSARGPVAPKFGVTRSPAWGCALQRFGGPRVVRAQVRTWHQSTGRGSGLLVTRHHALCGINTRCTHGPLCAPCHMNHDDSQRSSSPG